MNCGGLCRLRKRDIVVPRENTELQFGARHYRFGRRCFRMRSCITSNVRCFNAGRSAVPSPTVEISGATMSFTCPGRIRIVPGGISGPAPTTTIGNTGRWVSMAIRNAPSLNGCNGSFDLFCVPSTKISIDSPSISRRLSLSMLRFRLSPLDRSTITAAERAIQPKTGMRSNSFFANGRYSPGNSIVNPGMSRNEVWLLT